MTLLLECYICGLARECAPSLPRSLASVEGLSACFQHADLVVVTNDSTDETSEILTEWAATRAWATVIEVDGLASAILGRTDRLATLRNMCLFELRRRMEFGKRYDLMIVFDFDGVNENLTAGDEFCHLLLGAPPDWGGIFANQRQAYYDLWALRHSRWCPEDCWQEVGQSLQVWPFLPRSFGRPLRPFRKLLRPIRGQAEAAAVERFVGQRQVKMVPGQHPIPVESAFGGIGIYKTCLLGNSWYSGRDNLGHEVCEHVAFNFCVRRAGGTLYIIPALLNDAPLGHLAPGSGAENRPWE